MRINWEYSGIDQTSKISSCLRLHRRTGRQDRDLKVVVEWICHAVAAVVFLFRRIRNL